ncbi:hypothetical protein AQUCO_00900387v1 [Aquilegia coerulea]|uniref:Uncharacterized protein n=1 Tax=Aquilegia coerulea TaxID=218851 RepID=A0A2G5EDD9_AQUCA|nr:hypothetical protein AQUCO_00900387v1 [Aquilegia coerulea]
MHTITIYKHQELKTYNYQLKSSIIVDLFEQSTIVQSTDSCNYLHNPVQLLSIPSFFPCCNGIRSLPIFLNQLCMFLASNHSAPSL